MRRTLVAALFFGIAGSLVAAFDPRAAVYAKRTATCGATLRTPNAPDKTVNIGIRYVNVNPKAKTTIVLVHGWPSVWSSWARQIEEFGDDYNLIVPNLRGFADSTFPGGVRTSGTLGDIVDDLVCVLQKAGVAQAVCMGHDWGSSVCYEAGRARPDIFVGVIGAVVPYNPNSGLFVPIALLLPLFPRLTYQLFFDNHLDQAVAELDADVRRTVRATLRTIDSPPPAAFLTSSTTFMGAYDGIKIPAVPFLSSYEEDYFVEELGKQRFNNTLYFYTTENRQLTWQVVHDEGNSTLTQPVLAIYPTQDPVADWSTLQFLLGSANYIPDLTVETIKAAHWPQLEQCKAYNSLVRGWLNERFPA